MAEEKKSKAKKETTNENSTKCDDQKCPFHAGLSVRGKKITGEIIKKNDKTVKVEWIRSKYIPKYERFTKVKSGVFAHLPGCISKEMKIGDKVKITECRPLSKTKHFVVMEKVKIK